MNKIVFSLMLLLFLSVFTVLPLFRNGFFEFHDNTQVVRVAQMGKMLSQNVFPVRWVPDLGYGYGYPIFNFYSPLPYYIGGIINVIGFDSLFAAKSMFIIGILIAPLSMFLLLRKFFGYAPAIVGATIYTYFPYHATNIYIRGAVGELFAYAFLPIIFWGLFALIESSKKKNLTLPIVRISIGVFLVAISHNLSLFMVLITMLPIILLAFLLSGRSKKFLFITILSTILGLLLASFFILPAFYEMGLTNVNSQVGGGADFREHFVCIGQYWESLWGYGGSVPGCIDGMSFKIGKSNLLFLFLSILTLVFTLRKKTI